MSEVCEGASAGTGPGVGAGGRKVTVPKPFTLIGCRMHAKAQSKIEEARRRADESASKRRMFKARPMPDFSRPFLPKPHD